MTMQSGSGAAGRTLVTIARAAELLSASGDQITAPNVSRYVERFKDVIWSEKRGRERLVDLVELMDHRRTNVRVADKQMSRGIEAAPAPQMASVFVPPPLSPAPETPGLPDDADAEVEPDSVAELTRALKKLELRRRQREEDLADGAVIAADEVLELISTTLGTLVTAFEQQEPIIAQRFGRDTAAAFRRCRKDAQAQAAKALADLANRHMPQNMAAAASEAAVVNEEKGPEPPVD